MADTGEFDAFDPSGMVSGADSAAAETSAHAKKKTPSKKTQNKRKRTTPAPKIQGESEVSDEETIDSAAAEKHATKKKSKPNNDAPALPVPVAAPVQINYDSDDDFDPDYEFKVKINEPRTLSETIQIVGSLVQEIPIWVESSDKFSGILIDCMDSTSVCTIMAKLTADVKLAPNCEQFVCIHTKYMNSCLTSVSPSSTIRLVKKPEDNGLYCSAYEGNSVYEDVGFRLQLIEKVYDPKDLMSMEHEYTIDINLDTIRKTLKNAKDLEAEDIEFTVLEPTGQRDFSADGISIDTPKHIFVKIDITGSCASIFKMLHSVTRWEHSDEGVGSFTIRTVDVDQSVDKDIMSNLEVKFRGKYACEYFSRFIKCMAKQTLTLSLGSNPDDREQPLPMIIHYPLGDEQSFIRLAIAPKYDDPIC
jgi:hypothetical protein